MLHLKILEPRVRGFLEKFLQEVEAERVPTTHWLKAVNQVLKLTTNRRASKITDQHRIYWADILPTAAIGRCSYPKVQRFREQQLGKGTRDSSG